MGHVLNVDVKPEQIRYAQMKARGGISQRDIAKQLGVHYNTLTNWNKLPEVKQMIENEVQEMRKENSVATQRLMASILKNATELMDSPDISTTAKVQMIGQLFTQCGKFAGLEPPKQVQKDVRVSKSLESIIDMETTGAEDMELA